MITHVDWLVEQIEFRFKSGRQRVPVLKSVLGGVNTHKLVRNKLIENGFICKTETFDSHILFKKVC
ncbi:hypothetical protein KJBENDCP_00034 [Klebsiella phage vB_KmiS-Kmi2C]|nr:hypothetical protein KJBENDCP_00034 [Klebsiella phage vB_KmiS-Kmi2C]